MPSARRFFASEPWWSLPLLLVPTVVAVALIDWLGTRPSPWNWLALSLVGAYLVLVAVLLQRDWNKGKRRRRSRGRHLRDEEGN